MPRRLIAVLIITLLFPLAGCNLQIGNESVGVGQPDIETPEGAREKIAQLNIPYTVDEFVKCARESDTVAVKLFLNAGMNPHAKDGNGTTALAAATQAGHSDIVDLLKEASAEK